MPKVTVIIPNYNHAQYLAQRLDSVFQQTYQDFEVILLDDCSTDQSVEILKQYANHPKVSHLIINGQNSGSPFKQWKKGIDLAQGEYIWLAESDDWAEQTFLEKIVPLLDNGCVLAYCRSVRVEEDKILDNDYFWADALDNKRWKHDFINEGMDEIKNYLIYRNTIPNASACLFQKSMVNFPEGLDTMRFCGDWLFWIQLLTQGKLGFTASKLNYFRVHQQTSRHLKTALLEKQRLKEYFAVINYARNLAQSSSISFQEAEQYNWILKEIIVKSSWKNVSRPPPIPLSLYFWYYQRVLKRFLKWLIQTQR